MAGIRIPGLAAFAHFSESFRNVGVAVEALLQKQNRMQAPSSSLVNVPGFKTAHSASTHEISQTGVEETYKAPLPSVKLAQWSSKEERDRVTRPTERSARPSALNGHPPLMLETVQLHTLPDLKQLLERTRNSAGQDGEYQLMARLMYEIGPPRDLTLRYPDTLPTRIDDLLLAHKPLLGQADTHLVVVNKAVSGRDVPHGFAIKTDALLELQDHLLGNLRYSQQYYKALLPLWD